MTDYSAAIGRSRIFVETLRWIDRLAKNDATVLLTGESGTGKEILARRIHEKSARADKAFIPVNCSAIPAELTASMFFGHVKGSFTGASENHTGYFEQADGGTLLLDEIGDMPPQQQVQLLRVLEDGVIRRVGGTKDIKVDVRVIAATNADIDAAIEAGSFRDDLFFRLNVGRVNVPPLREREDDVIMLAHHFLDRYAPELGVARPRLGGEAESALLAHGWPGNVRELIGRIRQAVLMCENGEISPADLGLRPGGTTARSPSSRTAPHPANGMESAGSGATPLFSRSLSDQVDRNQLTKVIVDSGYNLSQAARDLGVSRPTLYKLMRKHRLRRDNMLEWMSPDRDRRLYA
ncbi:MAG: sigma-54 dependent transcriptional regulator [Azospirillaceae bacterium]